MGNVPQYESDYIMRRIKTVTNFLGAILDKQSLDEIMSFGEREEAGSLLEDENENENEIENDGKSC